MSRIRVKKIYSTTIKPREPYNFELTASCYATCWDFDGERAFIPYTSDKMRVAIVASRQNNEINIEIFSESSREPVIDESLKVANHVLGMEEDIANYYRIIRDDPLLKIVLQKLQGLHMRAVPTLWEGLIIGVCQQNASFRQGWRMIMNIRKALGDVIHIKEYNVITYCFPSPERILQNKEKIRAVGVGYRSNTLVNASKAFLSNRIEDLESIRGIGQYTARFARVIALRKYDEFPIDRWFMRLLPTVYSPGDYVWTKRQVEDFSAKRWGNWRGLSAIMITIVTAAMPLTMLLRRLEKGDLEPMPEKPSPLTLWRYMY